MDKIKLRAIVIKEIPLGESDKIIVLMAKGAGKIYVKAKGARNAKNKTSCGTSLFSYCDYILIKTKTGLIMTQADIIESFYNITLDLDKFAYSSVAMEVTEKVCRENEVDDEIMFLLLKTIHNISKGNTSPKTILAVFYIKFMHLFGCMPDVICECGRKPKFVGCDCFYCEKCKKGAYLEISEASADVINYIIKSEVNKIFAFKTDENTISKVEKAAHYIFNYHIGLKIKSWEFIKSIRK